MLTAIAVVFGDRQRLAPYCLQAGRSLAAWGLGSSGAHDVFWLSRQFATVGTEWNGSGTCEAEVKWSGAVAKLTRQSSGAGGTVPRLEDELCPDEINRTATSPKLASSMCGGRRGWTAVVLEITIANMASACGLHSPALAFRLGSGRVVSLGRWLGQLELGEKWQKMGEIEQKAACLCRIK